MPKASIPTCGDFQLPATTLSVISTNGRNRSLRLSGSARGKNNRKDTILHHDDTKIAKVELHGKNLKRLRALRIFVVILIGNDRAAPLLDAFALSARAGE
jgi:hypothetical protein